MMIFCYRNNIRFYKAPVKVTIEAEDLTSGIKSFAYSYKVDNGVSDVNAGKSDVVIAQEIMLLSQMVIKLRQFLKYQLSLEEKSTLLQRIVLIIKVTSVLIMIKQ